MQMAAPSPNRVRTAKSLSNSHLRKSLQEFTQLHAECLVVTPGKISGWVGNLRPTGALGLHVVTFAQAARQLAEPRLADAGLAPLNTFGTEALAARAVFDARKQNLLQRFAPVATLPGFARALARTLLELRLAGVDSDRLSGDLATLHRLYEQGLIDNRLADLPRILNLATEAVTEGQHRWANLPVAFLDVPLTSQAHRTLFEALLLRAPSALIASLEPEEAPVLEDSLDRLRTNLFRPNADPSPADGKFEFFSAPGEGLESAEIARRLLRLAGEGVRFDDCAILLRNPERYQPTIEDALVRAGIPAYFSRGATRPDPAGRAFLALLNCASENLSATRFAEYMSLGQVPAVAVPADWVPPSDELLNDDVATEPAEPRPESSRPTPRRWEQYLVDAAVIGGRDRWERRLLGLEAEWVLQDRDNTERLGQLRNLREFALPLIDQLSALPKTTTWADWIESLRDLAARALRGPEGVLEVLAELAPMGDVGPATLEEVTEVLADRLRFLHREPPQRRWGHVLIASIDEARGCEFGTVFLPGLAEGLFPQKTSEDPLLLDELRRAIDEHLPLRHDRVSDERERLHLAAAAARDRLIASYPRMEVTEARPRVPSFYALELPRAIDGALPELAEFEKRARDAAPARLNWPAPKNKLDAIDDAEFDLASIAHQSAQHVLAANVHAARSLRARWARWDPKWRAADGLVTKDPAALEALSKERLAARSWSPSSLENFSSCPYKFALHGIYRLRPREDAAPLEQMDPLTRGSLFHAVQDHLHQELKAADALPVTRDSLPEALAKLEIVLQRVASDYEEKLVPAIPRVWRSEIEELRADLRGWLHFTATNEYDWTPTHFEMELETEIPDLVNLHGRIDVIEQKDAALRVTDYKTGKAPDTIPRWVGGGKYLQPLLYALAAEQQLGAPVESGRLLFATQRGNYTTIQIPLDNRARLFIAKLLEDIDGMIANGFLPPVPEKDACELCDYRVVCGPYEERRLMKKHRQDEALDPLYEIRGMA